MEKLDEKIGQFASMLSGGLEKQKQLWHGYFNHQAEIGDNFYKSLMNNVKMSFFGSALKNGRSVYCNQIKTDFLREKVIKNELEKLKSLNLKVIISDFSNDFVLSSDNTFAYITPITGKLVVDVISFDQTMYKQIEELLNK